MIKPPSRAVLFFVLAHQILLLGLELLLGDLAFGVAFLEDVHGAALPPTVMPPTAAAAEESHRDDDEHDPKDPAQSVKDEEIRTTVSISVHHVFCIMPLMGISILALP